MSDIISITNTSDTLTNVLKDVPNIGVDIGPNDIGAITIDTPSKFNTITIINENKDSAILLERVSPDPPSVVGQRLWWDASDTVTIDTDDAVNRVSQLNPKPDTSAVDSISQSILADQPETGIETRNNLNVIGINVTGQGLSTSTATEAFTSQLTGFMVLETTTNGGNVFEQGNGEYEISTSSQRVRFLSPAGLFSIVETTTQIKDSLTLITWIMDNVEETVKVRINGTQEGSTNDFIGTISSGTEDLILGQETQGGRFKFAELIVYNRILTDGQIDQVESDLLSKWGIS